LKWCHPDIRTETLKGLPDEGFDGGYDIWVYLGFARCTRERPSLWPLPWEWLLP
jgi:hypothetical protein